VDVPPLEPAGKTERVALEQAEAERDGLLQVGFGLELLRQESGAGSPALRNDRRQGRLGDGAPIDLRDVKTPVKLGDAVGAHHVVQGELKALRSQRPAVLEQLRQRTDAFRYL